MVLTTCHRPYSVAVLHCVSHPRSRTVYVAREHRFAPHTSEPMVCVLAIVDAPSATEVALHDNRHNPQSLPKVRHRQIPKIVLTPIFRVFRELKPVLWERSHGASCRRLGHAVFFDGGRRLRDLQFGVRDDYAAFGLVGAPQPRRRPSWARPLIRPANAWLRTSQTLDRAGRG